MILCSTRGCVIELCCYGIGRDVSLWLTGCFWRQEIEGIHRKRIERDEMDVTYL